MPRPPNKSPSEPELEFGEAPDEVPTGKFPPAGRKHRPTPARTRSQQQPETMPAPASAELSATMMREPPPQRSDAPEPTPVAPPVRPLARIPTQPRDPRKAQTADEARSAARVPSPDDDELFGALGKALTFGSERPTQDSALRDTPLRGRVGTPSGKIVPPPPRLPTLGPEQEFSLGIEELPKPPPSAPPAMPRSTARPRTEGDDLSWDLKSDRARPGGVPEERFSGTPLPPARHDPGDAHALVERASVPPILAPTGDSRRELSERYAMGDFSGALVIAEGLLADGGTADAEVRNIAQECRARLQQMYASRLGDLKQVPGLAVPRSELKWLSLDHRAGFVLSLVDGTSNMEEIIDVAGMPALEVLRTLYDLMIQRVIEFRASGPRK